MIYSQTISTILKKNLDDDNIYAKNCLIPLGTKRPYYEYDKCIIPEEEIVFVNFDPISTPTTQREAFNTLLLGASGDGKSLIIKQFWKILHDAGYFCVYIDPKSVDSGRARIGWENKARQPPYLKPKGIKLKHYLPSFKAKEFNLAHNFHLYSLKPSNLKKLSMWIALNQTPVSAENILEIIRNHPNINVDGIIDNLYRKVGKKMFNSQAFNSAQGKLILLKHNALFDNYPQLNLMKDFQEGYSVCISYRGGDDEMTCLDIGEKIYRANSYYFTEGNRNPIMFFFDDASLFADTDKVKRENNFAVNEIMNIGYNYRSNGICNLLAVQSLNIINQSVADSYPIKIISPLFNNPQSLANIGVPSDAIAQLKYGELMIDDYHKTMEWLLINKKSVQKFFPFLPVVNHFKEVYFE